ncbi:MAG: hypothetical protein GX989_04755 [Firmicutes bacterium]|nr:hypothetical protein [Bacillota bacterium]
MGFDRWLQRFVTTLEKIIFRAALAFVVLLFVVQAVLLNGNLRVLFSKTDQLEGEPFEKTQDVFGKKVTGEKQPPLPPEQEEEISIEVALFSPPGINPELYLLRNNDIVGSWQENKNLRVDVKPGDLLEVVGDVPGEIPATIKVVKIYGELKAPETGHAIQTFGEREFLAWIIP